MKKTTLRNISALFALALMANPLLASQPKYKANVPTNVLTPETVQTKYAGTLHFKDGFPDKKTVSKTYDFLDTARATMVFTNTVGSFYAGYA